MISNNWRLRTQIAVLVLSVLMIAQAISLWLFVDERSLAVQAAIATEAAGRAANVARLIESAPERLRPDIIEAANSPLVRFDLADAPSVTHFHHGEGGAVEARIRALLADGYSKDIRVEVHEIEHGLLPLPNLSPEMAEMHADMMRGTLAAIEMELSIAILGGRWLNVGTRFERPPIQWSWSNTLSFALTAAMLVIACFWFLLARLTRPLNTLAVAAERLGRGASDGPLQPVGPKELRDVTRAFNEMQNRLTRFVSDRTQMLAALAHDLRSPLTALRVRAEMVAEDETRESLVTSAAEMQEMVDATLAYAKGVGQAEEVEDLYLGAFLSMLQETNPDRIEIQPSPALSVSAKPFAMRRAMRNLLENAIQYGNRARIGWSASHGFAEIRIDDDGPGIPKDHLEQVFAPYFRLEKSRSRATGGHGLGLSIARSICLAHGGTIGLENRPGGGLRAIVRLPMGHLSETDAPEHDGAAPRRTGFWAPIGSRKVAVKRDLT